MPRSLLSAMARSAAVTAPNTGMTVTVGLNHGGHSDIAQAVRSIVAAGVPADQITERTLAAHLPHSDMPPVDLLIRTSVILRTRPSGGPTSPFWRWEPGAAMARPGPDGSSWEPDDDHLPLLLTTPSAGAAST